MAVEKTTHRTSTASNQLLHLAFRFLDSEPAAAARLLELEEPQAAALFLQQAPQKSRVVLLQHLLPRFSAAILADYPLPMAAATLNACSYQQVAAILRYTPKGLRQALLNAFSLRAQTACNVLLDYNEQSIGAWMVTDIPVLLSSMTTGDALLRLKKHEYRESERLYLVDKRRHLEGILNPVQLLRTHGATPLASLPQQTPFQLNGRTRLTSAIQRNEWQHRDWVAVNNRQGELIGVLHHHQLRAALAQQIDDPQEPPLMVSELCRSYGQGLAGLLETFQLAGSKQTDISP